MEKPYYRPRRLRRNEAIRSMVRETHLSPSDFIYPFFVCPGSSVRKEIGSMPGVFNLSRSTFLLRNVVPSRALGIPAVLLFGLPPAKDEVGSDAYAEDGIVQQAVRAIKSAVPDLLVITDLCLCEYTSHGHCGQLRDGDVANDETLRLLAKAALAQARAGADIIAPSDMMDGRVRVIREALDEAAFRKHSNPGLCREVCLRVLRPLS